MPRFLCICGPNGAGKARGGHDIPREDVVRRFHRSLVNLPKAQELADSFIVLGNSAITYQP